MDANLYTLDGGNTSFVQPWLRWSHHLLRPEKGVLSIFRQLPKSYRRKFHSIDSYRNLANFSIFLFYPQEKIHARETLKESLKRFSAISFRGQYNCERSSASQRKKSHKKLSIKQMFSMKFEALKKINIKKSPSQKNNRSFFFPPDKQTSKSRNLPSKTKAGELFWQ